ncbi:YeeE/YedE family protein [Natrialbaceae archaeon A-gly3]
MSADHEQHPLFMPLVFAGGLIFGFGLGFSHMAQPEVVLNFLQFADFGLLFVMFGAAVVTGITFFLATAFLGNAPLTGMPYGRRLKTLDRNVLFGGAIFGVGWGLSGICPGAAYASLGVGNYPILWGVAGMFVGAYIQGYARSALLEPESVPARAGDD